MKNILSRLCTAAMSALLLASAALAQSEGVLVLSEADQNLISRVQEHAVERQLKNKQADNNGPMDKARELTAAMTASLKEKNFEKAAASYWAGADAGVIKLFEERRDAKLAAAREAAQDAVALIQTTARRNAENSAADRAAQTIVGEAADKIAGDMRGIQQEKAELDRDLQAYVKRVGELYPELRHVLQEAGLTPANIREIVVGRLREANQLTYEAGLAESNRIVWSNMARVIRARYANGGEPQMVTTPSTRDVIETANRDKMFN